MMTGIVFAVVLLTGGSYAAQESTEPDIVIPSSGKEIILQPIGHFLHGESHFVPVDSHLSEKAGDEASGF
jgi:hypothetical protein